MNTPIQSIVTAVLLGCVAMPSVCWASPETAEKDGMLFKNNREGSLYSLQLVDSDIATAGSLIEVKFSVSVGVDYCIVTGRDNGISDIDLYVYSEHGVLLAEDRGKQSRGAVKWRSQYSGEATAYVQIVRTSTIKPGSYAVFRGSLEIPHGGKPGTPEGKPQ